MPLGFTLTSILNVSFNNPLEAGFWEQHAKAAGSLFGRRWYCGTHDGGRT